MQEVLRRQAGFTKKEISRAKFLPDGIRKNGIRCRVTEKTLPGDIIEILLETETQCSGHLTANTEVLDILYEDQDLLAVNKPAGVVTHPQGGHYEDTLANQVSAYYAPGRAPHRPPHRPPGQRHLRHRPLRQKPDRSRQTAKTERAERIPENLSCCHPASAEQKRRCPEHRPGKET